MAVFAYLGEVHAFKFSRKLPVKSMKLCTLFFAMLTNCIVALSWHNCLHEACTSTNFFHNFQVSHFQYESAWAIHSLLRRANAWNVSFRDSNYPIIPGSDCSPAGIIFVQSQSENDMLLSKLCLSYLHFLIITQRLFSFHFLSKFLISSPKQFLLRFLSVVLFNCCHWSLLAFELPCHQINRSKITWSDQEFNWN